MGWEGGGVERDCESGTRRDASVCVCVCVCVCKGGGGGDRCVCARVDAREGEG